MPIRVDASELKKVARIAKEFSPELRKQMMKQLRNAGAVGAAAAKEAILEMPSKGNDDHQLRQLIAKAITVNVTTTARPDIRIRVRRTPALNAIGAGGIAKAINTGKWRHPVFAKRDSPAYKDPNRWKDQSGPEFFDDRIWPLRPVMELAVKKALDDAIATATSKGRL